MQLRFSGPVWYWRGPSPYHFVTVPNDEVQAIKTVAGKVTYGWGMIPAMVTVGGTEFYTALFPKDGGYIVPLKDVVRNAEEIDVDDEVEITLKVDAG